MNKEEKIKRHSSPDRVMTPTDFRTSVYLERKQDHQKIMRERLSSMIQQRRDDATLIKKERRKILRKKH